jgi:nucleoside phosphorylase
MGESLQSTLLRSTAPPPLPQGLDLFRFYPSGHPFVKTHSYSSFNSAPIGLKWCAPLKTKFILSGAVHLVVTVAPRIHQHYLPPMAQRPLKKLDPSSYFVAIICPLSDVEAKPAVLMLDERHERPDIRDNEDAILYSYGSAAGHNIVIATCRQGMTGNVNTSSITGPLFKTFPNIRMTLLVGIGGGVPQPKEFSNPLADVHLGDVVVGWPISASHRGHVIYYESGRSNEDGFEITGSADKPHTVLVNGLTALKHRDDFDESTFDVHLKKLQDHPKHGHLYRHPGLNRDKLFKATYPHVNKDDRVCAECDSREFAEREPREDNHKELFIYHQGHIATGNSVVKSARKRDSINDLCGGVLCIEMEAAGVEVNGRCLVIRGISDYADSHKNDLWKSYAAGKAVVFARELLGVIPAQHIKETMASGQSGP